eukprot:TRINITY_DN14936_c0_g1_i1.p1 TRINITY_DN14936_c0_g1~~TRINITY_DN14936_c0_g1_i1.p1  ORF type:complete len:302 (+),score=69.32 TRINITY_DN14936_c0_g1_i1:92-997(+)
MDDWAKYTDPDSGFPYWYSASRDESTWSDPNGATTEGSVVESETGSSVSEQVVEKTKEVETKIDTLNIEKEESKIEENDPSNQKFDVEDDVEFEADVVDIEERDGVSMYQIISGNVPVITKEFIRSQDDFVQLDSWERFSGNRPIISMDYHVSVCGKPMVLNSWERMTGNYPQIISPKYHRSNCDDSTTFAGYLLKKGGGTTKIFGRRNWKKRFFQLKSGNMRYWKSENNHMKQKDPMKGAVIDLDNYELDHLPGHSDGFFLLPKQSQTRTWQLRCTDEEELEIWKEKLGHTMKWASYEAR